MHQEQRAHDGHLWMMKTYTYSSTSNKFKFESWRPGNGSFQVVSYIPNLHLNLTGKGIINYYVYLNQYW